MPGGPPFTSLFKRHASWRRSCAWKSLRMELLELSVRRWRTSWDGWETSFFSKINMVATKVASWKASIVPQVVRESGGGLTVHRLPAEYKVRKYDLRTFELKGSVTLWNSRMRFVGIGHINVFPFCSSEAFRRGLATASERLCQRHWDDQCLDWHLSPGASRWWEWAAVESGGYPAQWRQAVRCASPTRYQCCYVSVCDVSWVMRLRVEIKVFFNDSHQNFTLLFSFLWNIVLLWRYFIPIQCGIIANLYYGLEHFSQFWTFNVEDKLALLLLLFQMSVRRNFCEILLLRLKKPHWPSNIIDSMATRCLDEPSAGNDIIYIESSSNSEAEQEKDDTSVCETLKPSDGIKSPETVSCLQSDSFQKIMCH